MASLTPKQARSLTALAIAGALLVLSSVIMLVANWPGHHRQSATAVDQCELKEYLEECEAETATKTELENCKRKASIEATRIAAGIPPECRGKKG